MAHSLHTNFVELCPHLHVEQLTTTTFHCQTNLQLRECNIIIATLHFHDHQRNRSISVHTLICGSNTKVQKSMDTTSFSRILSLGIFELPTSDDISAPLLDTFFGTEPQELRARLLARVKALHTQVKKTIHATPYIQATIWQEIQNNFYICTNPTN